MRPYLRVANVYEDRIDTSDVLEMNFDPKEFERYQLLPGDILLNEGQSRELVGRPAIYRGEIPGACFQNTLVRFRAGPALTPEFSLLVFRNYLHSGRFQQIAKWTTSIAHLGVERFAQIEFPVPPLAEQQRIVTKYKTLQARSRRAKEALNAIPALLERFRQSVLAAAFRGDLTADWRAQHPDVEPASQLLERIRAERRPNLSRNAHLGEEVPAIPSTWHWVTIEELASSEARSIQSGPFGSNLLHSEFQETGVLAIGIDNVLNGHFSLGNQNRISPQKHEDLKKYTARPYDVLITVMATVGRCCVVPPDLETAIITKHVYRISEAVELGRAGSGTSPTRAGHSGSTTASGEEPAGRMNFRPTKN
jgi:type I restriction enzyme S subunit